MRLIPTISAKTACLAAALTALASVASAAEIKMHVPVTARWGNQVLPAGDYRLDLKESSPFLLVSGNGKMATVLVTAVAPQSFRGHGYLKIIDVNGTPTVKAFGSETQGLTFEFAVSKSQSHSHAGTTVETSSGF